MNTDAHTPAQPVAKEPMGAVHPSIDLTSLTKGQQIARTTHPLSRDTLVRYAGASGDFNPIHYNDTAATEAGLPGVIAHGMLTMGVAINGVIEAIGDPTAVRSYSVRFTSPIEVPATGEVLLEVVAVVGAVDEEAGTARIDLTAQVGETKVLGRARATVALPTGRADAPVGGAA